MERKTNKISYELPQPAIDAIHRFIGGRVRNWHVVTAAMLLFIESSKEAQEDVLRRISSANFPGNKTFDELFPAPAESRDQDTTGQNRIEIIDQGDVAGFRTRPDDRSK